MTKNSGKFLKKYRIRSARLHGWNYASEGVYFVTICTKNKEHLLGEIVKGKLIETEPSKICETCWLDLPNHYSNCVLDAFVIMPNHVHGIISIQNTVETGLKPVSTTNGLKPVSTTNGLKPVSTTTNGAKPVSTNKKTYSLSEIVRGFKTFTARKINAYQNTPGKTFWQSRFYDHIVRSEKELDQIREYIYYNPVQWEYDKNKAENIFM